MKHHVFLFLSIFSFFAHAMDHDDIIINKLTKEDIVYGLKWYNATFPEIVNHDVAQQEIKKILATSLTFEDKKEIVAKMQSFPFPENAQIIGDKLFLYERDSNESKSTVY